MKSTKLLLLGVCLSLTTAVSAAVIEEHDVEIVSAATIDEANLKLSQLKVDDSLVTEAKDVFVLTAIDSDITYISIDTAESDALPAFEIGSHQSPVIASTTTRVKNDYLKPIDYESWRSSSLSKSL